MHEQASWSFDFAQVDGLGGFVRLDLRPEQGVAWYWAYLVGPELGLIVVRDHEVSLPRRAEQLVVRADGLWAELVCETPGEHWSIGLEAFGVRLDEPADALRGEIGERLAIGLDIEWEIADGTSPGEAVGPAPGQVIGHASGPVMGPIVGEVLVGRDRIAFDGTGVFTHERGEHSWTTTQGVTAEIDGDGLPTTVLRSTDGGAEPVEILAVVPIPLDALSGCPANVLGATPDRLVRVLGRWTDDDGAVKVGWVDLVEQ